MKSYIEQAEDLYSKIIRYDIQPYASIVYFCLHDIWSIKTSQQLDILSAVKRHQYSYGACWEKTDIVNSIRSFDEQELEELKANPNISTVLIAPIDKICNEKLDIPLSQIYKNTFREIILTSEISRNQTSDNDLDEKEWISQMQTIPEYYNLVKFCVEYMYKLHNSVLNAFAERISIEFYILFSQSALKAEYLSIEGYDGKIEYQKQENEQIYNLYPDFLKGIKNVISSIKTVCTRINAYLDSNEINNEIISVSSEEPFGFNSSAPHGLLRFIETGYSREICDAICLIYSMSLIDIVYISTSENLQKLIALLNGIRQINDYCKDLSNNGILDQDIRNKVVNINDILEIKCAILITQITTQAAPEKDTHCIQYKLSEGYTQSRLDQLLPYIKHNNDNKYITFCRNKNKYKIYSLHKFDEKYKIHHFKYIKNSTLDKYNNYICQGIQCNIENSPIYEAIRNDDHNNVITLLTKLMDKPDTYKIKNIAPSLYVKAIRYIYNKTNKIIEKKQDSQKHINLLFKLLDALRLFTITYKPKHNTPYRFRPIFEHSFYQYNPKEHLITLYPILEYPAQDQKKIIAKLANNDSVFFIASWEYPRPINFDYIENFFMRYNRKAHFLYLRIREMSEEIQYNKNKELINEQLRDEQKRTVQLLTIFGTFIAFVSSIAGMLKSVTSIWSFLLFCMAFTGALTVFVGLVHLIVIPKKEKTYIIRLIIYVILTLAILFCIWKAAQFIYDNHLCDPIQSEEKISSNGTNFATIVMKPDSIK